MHIPCLSAGFAAAQTPVPIWNCRVTPLITHVYLFLLHPTQMRFPIGGECIMCCGSKLNNSLGRIKLFNSLGKQQHERDQVMLLETVVHLWASCMKANDFFTVFSSFELGGITKHLISGPAGNSEFCSPSTSGKENSLFPVGTVINCLLSHCHTVKPLLSRHLLNGHPR